MGKLEKATKEQEKVARARAIMEGRSQNDTDHLEKALERA